MEEKQATQRVIKKEHVHMGGPGAGDPSSGNLPAIKLHEVDGVIQSIEVHCTCGGTIMINCNYEAEKKEK